MYWYWVQRQGEVIKWDCLVEIVMKQLNQLIIELALKTIKKSLNV